MAKKVYLKGEEFVFSRVKGNKESTYRDGDINLTPANIGASAEGHTHDDRYYTESEINTKLNDKANLSHTHGNSDITGIDGSKITSGTIDLARLPHGALERLTVVADDTARFKLTSSTVQNGDTVKVTSSGKMYYVVDETKLSSEDGYEVYAAGTAASVPWSGVTGKPSTYTPSSHTHTKSQIIDFPSSLPANGGNSDTVNNHTVKSDVPENAVFTDTVYDDTEVKESIENLNSNLFNVKANMSHNIPRTIPKDITSYYNDGTIWKRLNGTDGFSKYEDIFVGDYFKMSRAISAYNQNQNYQLTGSDWVTIAGISTLLGNGDTGISYEHLVMVPGNGFGGTQHFGRSRMNPTNTTVGGYVGSEMHTTTIGEVVSSGSTVTTATINQQLYAEFGSHLKTTRELLSNSLNSTGYNRFGEAGGCSNNWGYYDCQAVLMSEIEVYGSIVWSSSGYDTGTAKMQLPLFANNRQAMNNRSSWYWLKDVASASDFCSCDNYGLASYSSAGFAYSCVRPRFVIAA